MTLRKQCQLFPGVLRKKNKQQKKQFLSATESAQLAQSVEHKTLKLLLAFILCIYWKKKILLNEIYTFYGCLNENRTLRSYVWIPGLKMVELFRKDQGVALLEQVCH